MADPQFSEEVRNAILDAIEAAIGTSPILRIRTGAKPANTLAARSGTVLATLNLPVDFMTAASGGVKSKSGTWEDAAADGPGTAAHFEISNSAGTVIHMQADVTATGGGGFMQVDNTSFALGQQFTITAFALNAPGA